MPVLAVDTTSRRIATLQPLQALLASQSYSRVRSAGTAMVVGVGAAVAAAAGAAAGTSACQGVGVALAEFGAGTAAGMSTANAVGATSAGAGAAAGVAVAGGVGASIAAAAGAAAGRTIIVVGVGPTISQGAGSAAGAATVAAVSTQANSGTGAAAGSSTGNAYSPAAHPTAAGVATVTGVSNRILGGTGTLAAVGSASGSSSAAAVGAPRFAAVGAAAGSSTAAAASANTVGVGAAACSSTAAAVGAAQLSARQVIPITSFPLAAFGDGIVLAATLGYGTGVTLYGEAWRLIYSFDDGQTWGAVYEGYDLPAFVGPNNFVIEPTGTPIRVSYQGLQTYAGSGVGSSANVEVWYADLWTGADLVLSPNYRGAHILGRPDYFNGTVGLQLPVAMGNVVESGGGRYFIGGDVADAENARLALFGLHADGLGVTRIGTVAHDPSDPNLVAGEFPFSTTALLRDGVPTTRNTVPSLKKFGSRWFYLCGDTCVIYYNDNASPTSGWRRIPLNITEGGGGILGLEQVGSTLIAWGERRNSAGNCIAWSANNGDTWTEGRPDVMSGTVNERLSERAFVLDGKLFLHPALVGAATTQDVIYASNPAGPWTRATESGMGPTSYAYVVSGDRVVAAGVDSFTRLVEIFTSSDGVNFTKAGVAP